MAHEEMIHEEMVHEEITHKEMTHEEMARREMAYKEMVDDLFSLAPTPEAEADSDLLRAIPPETAFPLSSTGHGFLAALTNHHGAGPPSHGRAAPMSHVPTGDTSGSLPITLAVR